MADNRSIHITTGKLAEEQACDFLLHKGFKLLVRNFRSTRGEIDLIMQDNDTVVFAEVRVRNNPNHGNAFESITTQKQKKIIKAATFYLYQQQLLNKVNCRFDAIGISYTNTNSTIEWLKNAFFARF